MIRGIHGLFYSSDPEATRTFFKEKVKLPGSDIGQGWWIFDLPEGDLGVHPVEDPSEAGGHDVSFYCDDIQGTVADMKSRGVVFAKEIADHGYGFVTYFEAPGGITVQLYEPRYVKGTARAKPKPARKKTAGKKAPRRKSTAAAAKRARKKKHR
jgi:catechol 2,3-dioxygenase-like lactoylglutathione lyase family enzyme